MSTKFYDTGVRYEWTNEGQCKRWQEHCQAQGFCTCKLRFEYFQMKQDLLAQIQQLEERDPERIDRKLRYDLDRQIHQLNLKLLTL